MIKITLMINSGSWLVASVITSAMASRLFLSRLSSLFPNSSLQLAFTCSPFTSLIPRALPTTQTFSDCAFRLTALLTGFLGVNGLLEGAFPLFNAGGHCVRYVLQKERRDRCRTMVVIGGMITRVCSFFLLNFARHFRNSKNSGRFVPDKFKFQRILERN